MIKRFIIAIVLLGVIGGGIVGFNMFRSQMIAQFFATMKPAPVTVSVSTVEPARWTPGLDAIGTARAAQGVDLAIEAPGIVREVAFQANDRIEKSQLMVQIDDRTERADLAAAQAALDLAETALARVRELRERGVSATTTLDTAEAQAVEARATVAKLNAVLETKRLVAPFAGIVGIPQVEQGQFVTAGTVYATLQDRDNMRVDFNLTEQQVGMISDGQKVSVTTEVGDLTLDGAVIGIEPKIDPNSRLVTIRADVDGAQGRLTPGQFLRVRVHLPEEDNVISLPQTVVSSTLYGDSVYVVRAAETAEDPEKVEQVFVTLGRRAGDRIEITTGLNAGDRVVNAGQNKLSGGAPVVIDNSVSPDTAAQAGGN